MVSDCLALIPVDVAETVTFFRTLVTRVIETGLLDLFRREFVLNFLYIPVVV
jgi:hypothetical protein